MSLNEYQRKRNFDLTAEPVGIPQSGGSERLFVVQKHLASHLHYDFRLEIDGVLKSWAIPKGPSLDPSAKRLAIHVEDHPLSYGRFEGVIPEGSYGAGKVIVWDTGSWLPSDPNTSGYEQGNLKFHLHGEKLQGKWALIKTSKRDERGKQHWLLIKERDSYARSEKTFNVINEMPRSVLTARDVNELTSWQGLMSPVPRPRADPASHLNREIADPGSIRAAKKAPILSRKLPQLATLTTQTPAGDDWLHEIKLDGYRLLATRQMSKVTLATRNESDWTSRFPTLAAAIQSIGASEFIVDGELVMLRSDGVSDFAALQNALRSNLERELVYFVFDLLYLKGYDLREVALSQRKSLLADLLRGVQDPRVQYCDHIVGNGESFFDQCRRAGLEGVISKKVSSRYRSGRSESWLKRKCVLSDDFVIAGYVVSQTRKDEIRSLVVGYYADGKLTYAGKVGTGFSDAALTEIRLRCQRIRAKRSPLDVSPSELKSDAVVWTRPALVARVKYIGWTRTKQLRHAVFMGLRADIDAAQVVQPEVVMKRNAARQPVAVAPSIEHVADDQLDALSDVQVTNPHKILYPSISCSKLDVIKYYVSVSQWMLPYVEHRPTSLLRYPDGIEQPSFFQKHPMAGMHRSIQSIADHDSDDSKPWLVISDLTGLASAVQMGTIEFHPWSSRHDRIDRPDRVIFDFDPDTSVDWKVVKDAANECRQVLKSCGLESFVKTSGGKGIHVVVPIVRRSTWDEVLAFAKAIAKQMETQTPGRYTSNLSKRARTGKILIDIHRNHRGATCVAAYSLRARHDAPVSMPQSWPELNRVESPSEFDIHLVSRQVAKRRKDPWAGFYSIKQALTKKVMEHAQSR